MEEIFSWGGGGEKKAGVFCNRKCKIAKNPQTLGEGFL